MINLRWARIILAIYAGALGLLVFGANKGVPVAFWSFVGRFAWLDKVGHFLLYGGLAFLVNVVWRCREWRWKRVAVLRGSALVLGLATVEEFSQLMFLRRQFDWYDVVADALGILVFGQLARRLMHGRAAKPDDLLNG